MILAASDIHSHAPWMRWLRINAVHAEALILAGDIVNQRGDDDAKTFKKRCERARRDVVALDAQVFACSGNHDYDPLEISPPPEWMLDAQRERTDMVIDGQVGSTKSGARVLCVPDGATFFEPGLLQCGSVDIVVTHAPPEATQIAGPSGEGCPGVMEFVSALPKPPRLVVCGHVHDPVERVHRAGNTTFLNLASGRRQAPFPPHARIDWLARRVEVIEHKRETIRLLI